jgi:DNA-binding PadR family transcriptional regulator
MAVKGWNRAQDPALLVLTALARGPMHGYALISDIEEISGVVLGPGTLYGVLARLEHEGLVQALPAEDRRRPYRITAAGSTALRTRLQAISAVASIGLRRLGTAPA